MVKPCWFSFIEYRLYHSGIISFQVLTRWSIYLHFLSHCQPRSRAGLCDGGCSKCCAAYCAVSGQRIGLPALHGLRFREEKRGCPRFVPRIHKYRAVPQFHRCINFSANFGYAEFAIRSCACKAQSGNNRRSASLRSTNRRNHWKRQQANKQQRSKSPFHAVTSFDVWY